MAARNASRLGLSDPLKSTPASPDLVILDPTADPCPKCNNRHSNSDRCLRCKGELRDYECIICANCDITVVRLIREQQVQKHDDEVLRRKKNAKLPEDVISGSRSLDTFHGPKWILDAVTMWRAAREYKPWLLITGPPGTGKSHLAASGLASWIEGHKGGGLFVRAFDMMLRLRTLQGDEQLDYLEKLRTIPALVIDDLGVENVSEFTRTIWHDIFCARGIDERRLPTLITSNLSLDQLAARWVDEADEGEGTNSSRLVRRITANANWIELTDVWKGTP